RPSRPTGEAESENRQGAKGPRSRQAGGVKGPDPDSSDPDSGSGPFCSGSGLSPILAPWRLGGFRVLVLAGLGGATGEVVLRELLAQGVAVETQDLGGAELVALGVLHDEGEERPLHAPDDLVVEVVDGV